MSEKLNFSESDLFEFLLNELIDVKTEVGVQKKILELTVQHLKSDETDRFREISEAYAQEYRKDVVQELLLKLKGQSNDFDDFLKSMID